MISIIAVLLYLMLSDKVPVLDAMAIYLVCSAALSDLIQGNLYRTILCKTKSLSSKEVSELLKRGNSHYQCIDSFLLYLDNLYNKDPREVTTEDIHLLSNIRLCSVGFDLMRRQYELFVNSSFSSKAIPLFYWLRRYTLSRRVSFLTSDGKMDRLILLITCAEIRHLVDTHSTLTTETIS